MKRTVLAAVTIAAACLAGLSSPQLATAQTPVRVTVTVTDIAEPKGMMMIALYDQAGYDTDRAIRGTQAAVSGASISATFDGLPPGKYAIKLFHDVDGDGKMGMNPFGMPVEPFAFSNNAKGQFGPAKWEQAAFEVTASGGAQTISLK